MNGLSSINLEWWAVLQFLGICLQSFFILNFIIHPYTGYVNEMCILSKKRSKVFVTISLDRAIFPNADVVIFHARDINIDDLPVRQNYKQIWAFYTMASITFWLY